MASVTSLRFSPALRASFRACVISVSSPFSVGAAMALNDRVTVTDNYKLGTGFQAQSLANFFGNDHLALGGHASSRERRHSLTPFLLVRL